MGLQTLFGVDNEILVWVLSDERVWVTFNVYAQYVGYTLVAEFFWTNRKINTLMTDRLFNGYYLCPFIQM